jgi:hypothetical protein
MPFGRGRTALSPGIRYRRSGVAFCVDEVTSTASVRLADASAVGSAPRVRNAAQGRCPLVVWLAGGERRGAARCAVPAGLLGGVELRSRNDVTELAFGVRRGADVEFLLPESSERRRISPTVERRIESTDLREGELR